MDSPSPTTLSSPVRISFSPPEVPSESAPEDWRLDFLREEESSLPSPFAFFDFVLRSLIRDSFSSTLNEGVSTIFAPVLDGALRGRFTGLTNTCSSREALWTKKESAVSVEDLVEMTLDDIVTASDFEVV